MTFKKIIIVRMNQWFFCYHVVSFRVVGQKKCYRRPFVHISRQEKPSWVVVLFCDKAKWCYAKICIWIQMRILSDKLINVNLYFNFALRFNKVYFDKSYFILLNNWEWLTFRVHTKKMYLEDNMDNKDIFKNWIVQSGR